MSHYTGDREGQQCYEECSEEDDHHNQYQYQDHNDEKTSPTLRDQLLSLVQKDAVSEVVSVVCGDGDDEGEVITTTTTTTWDPLLLWVRPQPCCLHAIAGHVRKAGLSALASVGCGVNVIGYEVNEEWWKSKYAPPTFIPLTFTKGTDSPPPLVPPTHALMCCYFNHAHAFHEYVSVYEGPALLIIGPTSGSRHTEPGPLDYQNVYPWTLTHTHRISNTDILACYLRHT
ncbi:hypothetical protein Pmani_023874 [Petrolisthes manimaculis]|uniref:Uncharacterized protein n=1 Tax=Petrolisthes manimaculis TaxID=1843537 RepID=A0AAE1PAW5_9EUCA|nr:hypothetical protein Pmani_023874 [Petrolisthes manimaculis]